jgi:hypothetical protein
VKRELVTSLLDILALLLVAGGIGWAAAGWERYGLGVLVAGAVVGLGAWVIGEVGERERQRKVNQ